MRHPLRVSLLLLTILVGTAARSAGQPPANYYDTIDASSASALRTTVHAVIDDHTRFPYTSTATDTWDILNQADQNPGDASRILDVYMNASYPAVAGGNANYNREHTWPSSYGFPNDNSTNYPFTDTHALFLADSGYNSSRGNTLYRQCDASCAERTTLLNGGAGGGSGTFSGNSNWRSGSGSTGQWRTWIGRQGDVARALLYLDVRYEGGTHGGTGIAEPDLILTNDLSLVATSAGNVLTAHMAEFSTLLAWHAADPVDAKERARNDMVFGFQGNRNPFIDHPEWVSCVFQGQCATVCTFSLMPASQSFAAAGGMGTVVVTTSAGCTWTATSNAVWVTVPSSATGSGTVGYSVAANNSTSSRIGTMTIAGLPFTVTQAGGTCSYSISPTSLTVPAGGTTGGVLVTALNGCAWTAVSNDAWITVTGGASGTGNGTVNYSVGANAGSQRLGTVTIAGQTFSVTQAAAPFTDDPLVAGTTVVKAVHFTELRVRIDAQLGRFGQSPHSYGNAISVGATVRTVDLTEMYAALNDALVAASPSQMTIAVPTITPTITMAIVSHINTLRVALLALETLP